MVLWQLDIPYFADAHGRLALSERTLKRCGWKREAEGKSVERVGGEEGGEPVVGM